MTMVVSRLARVKMTVRRQRVRSGTWGRTPRTRSPSDQGSVHRHREWAALRRAVTAHDSLISTIPLGIPRSVAWSGRIERDVTNEEFPAEMGPEVRQPIIR
jgi:hypothetical protein